MTTSGVYTFAPTLAELISEAAEMAGLDPRNLDHNKIVSIRNSLNYLTLEIATQDADRVFAIDQETQAVTSTASTSVFALASGSIDVLDERVIIAESGATVSFPLSRISREDYLMIPDKTTTGQPSQFYIDHSVLNTPTMYLWPVSDASYTITYDRMRFIEDSVALSDTADVRRIWLNTLTAGLAWRAAFKFNFEKAAACKQVYDDQHAIAKMESRARAPIVIEVRGFGRSRRRRA